MMLDALLAAQSPSPAAVIAFLVQSTLFLGLIFIDDKRMRKRNGAAAQSLVWICAIALVPLLTVIAEKTPPTRMSEYVGEMLAMPQSNEPVQAEPVQQSANAQTQSPTVSVAAPAAPVERGMFDSMSSWDWAILFYCLMVPALLARIPLGVVRLAELRRTSLPLRDPRVEALLQEAMRAVRYSGRCELRQSHGIESPLSFGIFQPIILLPASYYSKLSDLELRAVLLHELTHVRRRDPLRVLLIRVIESIFWFQPLLWLAGRRAQYLSEIVADDAVLEANIDPDEYANVIVKLIEIGEVPRRPLHLAAGIFSAPRMLVSRVECLLDQRSSHATRVHGRKILSSCLLLLIVSFLTLQFSPRSVVNAAVEPAGTTAVTVEDWVSIPAGPFMMGATARQQADLYAFGGGEQWMTFIKPLVEASAPLHEVELDAFRIMRHEVTNAQYRRFMAVTGHRSSGSTSTPRFDGPNQPVVNVTWNDAQSYCAWAGGRLPTEAEWEKAARGETGSVYPWGNDWDAAKLRSMDNIAGQSLPSIGEWQNWRRQNLRANPGAKPADVGSYPAGASPYGVMDMAGNVWEWVADWYDPQYYANSPRRNPRGPASGDFRVLRGGAWDTPRVVNYTWLRQTFMPPSQGRGVTGFRCVKDEASGEAP